MGTVRRVSACGRAAAVRRHVQVLPQLAAGPSARAADRGPGREPGGKRRLAEYNALAAIACRCAANTLPNQFAAHVAIAVSWVLCCVSVGNRGVGVP